mmetsp:Transcript_26748/g.61565  ORF Transcript_26748/g.61565 Transcript_26748/m.61565 type:complete len:259 (-) Transcript_26748:628-1404(-)
MQKVVLPRRCSINWDRFPSPTADTTADIFNCIVGAHSCRSFPGTQALLDQNFTFSLDEQCAAMAHETDQTVEDGRVVYPKRFIVDLVANKEWYDAQGVEQWYVVVVRDQTASRMSRQHSPVHCANLTLLMEEEEIGTDSIARAIHKYILKEDGERRRMPTATTIGAWYRETFSQYADIGGIDRDDPVRLRRRLISGSALPSGNNVVLVSYEILMKLPELYIKLIYEALNIESNYVPTAKDGNHKYMVPSDSTSEDVSS